MIESYLNQVESPRAPRPPPPPLAVSHKPPGFFEQEPKRGSRAKNSVGSVASCKIRDPTSKPPLSAAAWDLTRHFAQRHEKRSTNGQQMVNFIADISQVPHFDVGRSMFPWLHGPWSVVRGPVVIPRSEIRPPESLGPFNVI